MGKKKNESEVNAETLAPETASKDASEATPENALESTPEAIALENLAPEVKTEAKPEIEAEVGTEIEAETKSKKKSEAKAEYEEPHDQSDDEVFDPKVDKKFTKVKEPLSAEEQKKKKRKKIIIIVIIILVLLLAGGGVAAYFLFFYHPEVVEEVAVEEVIIEEPKYYSNFTGLEIPDNSLNSRPLYCVQVPNGLDGARPQVGLDQAGVVFEAIAEAGITRFAAIFQNPDTSVIGPIRSLRSYYLSWDTPFDCTIVHAGGSAEASAEVSSGRYRNLNESYIYMWRDYSDYWAPNNLMTSAKLLDDYNNANGWTTSDPAVFPRLRPADAESAVKQARKNAGLDQDDDSSNNSNNTEAVAEVTPLVKEIDVNFAYVPAFNVHYVYDENTNSYLRSYQNGQEHITYTCPEGLTEPAPKSDCGIAKQLSPSVVIAMMVDEYLDTDNYHHVIQTIGSGVAYIFQNGTAIKGTWVKNNNDDQITFKDASGNIISFTPGQIFISALPNNTGSVNY